jgi:uncharacterized protein
LTRLLDLSARDRHFAHAFGNQHRVLAFGGKLCPLDGQPKMEGFLLCCSGRLSTSRSAEFQAELAVRVTSAGWEATHASWKRDGAVITLASGETTANSQILHIVLTIDDPDETSYRRVFGYLSNQVVALSENCDPHVSASELPATRGVVARLLSDKDLADEMDGRRVAVYTGAGVSRASGIPTFDGDGSLTNAFPLMDIFPGAVFEWMVDRPQDLMSVVGNFQTALFTSQPNAAHYAIAQLERICAIPVVVTNNFDHLHELAGSRHVHHTHQEGASMKLEEIDMLVITGVSTDEHGLIDRLRSEGAKIVAIGPQPPSYLFESDSFVEGIAEEIFPSIVEHTIRARKDRSRPYPPPCTKDEFTRLVMRVSANAPHPHSKIHGETHWRRVASIGAHLATQDPTGDPWLVLLFALFHDSQRHVDGDDPEHGARAADLLRRMEGTLFTLSESRRCLLESACISHTLGEVSREPTTGLCWDSDRLDLWRCGIAPDPQYLSRGVALAPATITWTKEEHDIDLPWPALYDLYAQITDPIS